MTRKKSRNVKYLYQLIYEGFSGGFRWVTQPQDVYDEQSQGQVKKSHYLLHHPHSFHTAKVIIRGLKTTRPFIISLAFAHVYDLASENIDLCYELDPQDFFAKAKNSFNWSKTFNDQEFWAFTYKAFHARAIFLNTVLGPNEKKPIGHPFVQALDNFRRVFLEAYPIDQTEVLEEGDVVCQENIELAEDFVGLNKPIHDKYFPRHLTHQNGQGDGTDRLVPHMEYAERLAIMKFNSSEEELDLSKIPDEELFFYATHGKPKHHDAFKDTVAPPQGGPPENKELSKGKSVVRKYDAFRDYREVPQVESEDEDGREDPGSVHEKQEEDGDDMMGEAGVEEDIPEVKRLRLD
ncbi:hypothetical protein F4804DRAFT_349342 [Jackrogersella minutella]|nr:hypothetical protein F4804DRAFT_349342 [Jackrogersella minutella]